MTRWGTMWNSGAVAGALEDAEILLPGADRVAVLVGEDAGELMDVGEVVGDPGGQELREGDGAEGGVEAGAGEVFRGEVEGVEFGQILGADEGEVVEELRQRFGVGLAGVAVAVEGGEGLGLAELQEVAGAREPVDAFAVDEVGDDFVGAPGALAFVGVGQGFGEVAQEGVQGGGGLGEEVGGLGKGLVHGINSGGRFHRSHLARSSAGIKVVFANRMSPPRI
jgi:hypothetical protein